MKKNTHRRGVLLFSGGIDSTLAAIILLGRDIELVSLSVNYPGRPEGETRTTRIISRKLPFAKSVEVNIDTGGSLCPFPTGQGIDRGWIPYRNLLFWAIAAHKAVMLDATFAAAGHDHHDAAAFSDASEEFFTHLKTLFRLTGSRSMERTIELELPIYTASLTYLYDIRSAAGTTLDTGGWLALTRRGLIPRKIRPVSLGTITTKLRGAAFCAAPSPASCQVSLPLVEFGPFPCS